MITLVFLSVHFCINGYSSTIPSAPSPDTHSNSYSVKILSGSGSGEVQDWNLAPASLWLEVNFTFRVSTKQRHSSDFQILQMPDAKLVPVNSSWNRSGTFLRIIPLQPLKAGCDYQLRIPAYLNSDSQKDSNTSHNDGWKWTTMQNPPSIANGFVMSPKRLLPQPRSIQWTTFSFLSANKALLTDSTGGIFIVDLHPISGEVLNTIEVARLSDQIVSASSVRSVPLSHLFDFIFTTVPTQSGASSSSEEAVQTTLNASRIETGTLHRWRFHASDGNGSPDLEWVSKEILIENIPFIRSPNNSRPLGALECLDQETVLLGIHSLSSQLQNTPFDPDMIRRWEKISSSFLKAPLNELSSWKNNFLSSDSENGDNHQASFFVTGIFNPSLIEHHSETGIMIAFSSGIEPQEPFLAPEGPTSPSIHFKAPGRYLFRLQHDGYYGFPNRARSEFVALGGNPTPAADAWEEPAYPVGVMPLKSFQSEDIFQLPFPGKPISLTQIQKPHPLAGRFLIGVTSSSSGELHCITLNQTGGYLNSNAIFTEDLEKLKLNCHWLQQRPGTAQIYALGSLNEESSSNETGLWVMSPTTSQ